ncbi:MAG: translation initiation factor IF-2 [Ignavibacteria bacterium]|nr:translation initiation factor IF-2 [Ignavibacteria bacterium]
MSAQQGTRLFKLASQLNIGKDAIVEYLLTKGMTIENKPTTSLTEEMVLLVMGKFEKEQKQVEKQREKLEKHKIVRHESTPAHEGDQIVAHPTEAAQHVPIVEVAPQAIHTPAPEPIVHIPVPTEETAPTPQVVETAPIEQIQVEPEPIHEILPEPVKVETIVEKLPEVVIPEEIAVIAEPETTLEPVVDSIPQESKEEVQSDSSPDHAAGETGEETSESQHRKKRKKFVQVEYEAGAKNQLRGLTIVGKLELAPPSPTITTTQKIQSTEPGAKKINTNVFRTKAYEEEEAALARSKKPLKPREASATTTAGGPPKPKGPVKEVKVIDKKKKRKKSIRETITEEEVARAIRETRQGMDESSAVSSRNKLRQRKKLEREEKELLRIEELERESTILRITEFLTTGELANLMGVNSADIIMKCMKLGLMVSINQRLDKDTITIIADDYGYQIEFLDEVDAQIMEDEVDEPETLVSRPPIVTIMGHVDHGKTSLLDYIRSANVVAGEAGGITQHIGAYHVDLPNGKSISFLDTPGHEAFTAMRARGAKVTDIVVLVVAADDSVMPQTIEAISHAQAANVPIVVAINKIDRAEANPDRIKQQLADRNVLVEDWGGKYQSVAVSARSGLNVDKLLEKIVLEAEMLELKANPDRNSRGTVIEAHLDKGKGVLATVMVQKGTLEVGDPFVAGMFAGRVRALFDERGNRVERALPSIPVQVSGFDGLPQAGDIFTVLNSESEARDVAHQRQMLKREQQFKQIRHITLDDISRDISAGGSRELRLIIKGDVGGSVEALCDSLLKLSSTEARVSILHKGVGTISESDVMLAAASSAVIIGFNVSPSGAARKASENEGVDIRIYNIIYDCINEIHLALEGLLQPDIKEEITANVEVRQVFKISRIGVIAGCYVQTGKITRNDKVRLLRDGLPIFKGSLHSLKRIKDDVREVDAGYECGVALAGFNDIEVGDIIESYKITEVKRKLS